MAILQMERVEICAMKRDRKGILELLQLRGTVELRDIPVADEVFQKLDMSPAQDIFRRNADMAANAADILERYVPANKPALAFLRGRSQLTPAQYDAFSERREQVLRTAQQVIKLEKEITEAQAEILRCDSQEEALLPWLNLPVPQAFSGTKKTAVFIGCVESAQTRESLLELLLGACPSLEGIHVEIVSQSPEQTNFYLIALKREAALAEEALRAIGFIRPASPSRQLPKESRESLCQKRNEAKTVIETCTEEIKAVGESLQDFKLLEDHMRMRTEKYAAIEHLSQTRHVFVLEGYILQREAQALCNELTERFACNAVVAAVQDDDENVPVCLENNWFSRPVEGVLDSYSLPAKGELDPTGIMSIFYYIMFGLMFSDAGYGLILAVATGIILLKFKAIEHGLRMFMQMFFWCGLSTMVWGVVFSSYFGDAVDIFARLFLGRAADAPSLVPPLWFSPLEKPMWLLMFCLAIGVVHLTVGYVLNGITSFRRGDYSSILYDAVFPVAFIYPLIVILIGTDIFEGMLGFSVYTLPAGITNICLVVAGISAVGVLLFGGRESKNWGKRLLKGLYALYNVGAGWLSDILSYSRLLALGLATGVIASVMNQLGSLAGGGIVGFLLFTVVFIVGQALNFGINILGAYVHSNRLEYVEFFGKFYQGGGRKFSPLGVHTKYYRIEEDI